MPIENKKAFQPNADLKAPTPLVDEVKTLTGASSTVFQRMNDAGDMLRIATNVVANGGKRAIGTYIPAIDPSSPFLEVNRSPASSSPSCW